MKLALYYAPVSCALVPYLALTEAGANFDVHVVDFRRGEHMSADFLRLNPKHKVPVLVIDGEPLTENIAMQLWVARQFPAAALLPTGSLEEFRAIALMTWCASGIHPFLTPNILPQRYCDLPGSEESVRRCAHRMLRENFGIANDLLAGREWFFDHFTLPDAYFFWCFRRARQFNVDVSEFIHCQAHFDRVSARPSTQKLFAFEAAALADIERAS